MANENDNFKAGLFVILGIALAIFAIFLLTDIDKLVQGKQNIVIRYAIDDGIAGLDIGAALTLGDRPIGTVTKIQEIKDDDALITHFDIVAEIPADYDIYDNAAVELIVPVLGSGTSLNIRSVGRSTTPDGKPVPKHDGTHSIPGGIANTQLSQDLTRQFGIEQTQRQQIQDILAVLADHLPNITGETGIFLSKINNLTDDAQTTLSGVNATLDDLRKLVSGLNERREKWFTGIDNIVANLDTLSANANKLLDNADPDVRALLKNLNAISSDLKNKQLPQLATALKNVEGLSKNFESTSEETNAFVAAQTPVLARAIANMNLSSEQLKLAMIEIRRSPWRLLYSPDKAEIDSDNIYDAARSFALAAGSLDNATQTLRGLALENPNDTERIHKIITYLEAVFEKYEQTEKKFFDTLPPTPAK